MKKMLILVLVSILFCGCGYKTTYNCEDYPEAICGYRP